MILRTLLFLGILVILTLRLLKILKEYHLSSKSKVLDDTVDGLHATNHFVRREVGPLTTGLPSLKKSNIEQVRIDIEHGGKSVLSLMLHKDGSIGRSGNGSLPATGRAALGMIDSSVFSALIESVDEQIFSKSGTFEHSQMRGRRIKYRIAFLGPKPLMAFFEFRLGEDNRDGDGLLSYFDSFCVKAVNATDAWYATACEAAPLKS
jgi:hypothetical protein